MRFHFTFHVSRFTLLAFLVLPTACTFTPESGAVLFRDDFSQPDSGWNDQADVEVATVYLDGEYQIVVHTTQLTVWSAIEQEFGDVIVEVDARTASGPDDNAFGVICRHQDDDNFYFMMISADGFYGIGTVADGEVAFIHGEGNQMNFSEDIPTGKVTNSISATCIGDTLTLSVNGQELATATATEFRSGNVGLIAKSYFEPDVDVRFDNFVVTQP